MDSRLLQKKALILIELLILWGQGSATRISAHEMFTSLALGKAGGQAPSDVSEALGGSQWAWWISVIYSSCILVLVMTVIIIHCVSTDGRKDGEGPISNSVKEKIKTGQITGEDKKKLYQLFQETKERLIKDAEKNKEARKEAFNRVCQRKYEQFVKTAKIRHMEQRIGKAFAKPPTAGELTPAAGQGDTTGSAGVDRAAADDKPRSGGGEGKLVTPTELKRLTKLSKHRDDQDEMSEKECSEPGEDERKHYYNLRSHRVQLGEVTSPTQSDNGTQSQGRRHNRRRGDSAAAVARLRRMGRDSEGAMLPPLAGPGGME